MARNQDPIDPVAAIESMTNAFRELAAAPGRDRNQRAIHDGWRIILKGKKADVLRRFRDWMKFRRWEYGDDDVADFILPASWDHILNQIVSTNYTRLAGCLKQYQSIRLVWRSALRFGASRGRTAGIGKADRLAAQKEARKKAEDKAKAAEAERIKATTKLVMDDWAARRKTLKELMKGIRDVTIEMAEREEKRLTRRVGSLRAPRLEARCDKMLKEMKGFRLTAKRAHHEDLALADSFPRQIRNWNRVRGKLQRALLG